MSKSRCPTKVRRVTTHTWGRWGAWRYTIAEGRPIRQRKCVKCGKVARLYGDRGY